MIAVSCIRNELGEVVRICSDYHDDENRAFLEFHPEYYLSTVFFAEDDDEFDLIRAGF